MNIEKPYICFLTIFFYTKLVTLIQIKNTGCNITRGTHLRDTHLILTRKNNKQISSE